MNTHSLLAPLRTIASPALLVLALAMTGCGDLMVNAPVSRADGIKQYNAGQYAEAAGTFRATLRTNPTDYGSCYFLGACMAKMGSYEQAIEKYRATLVLMNTSITGREDHPFRMQCLNSLADAFVASKDHHIESAFAPGSPAAEQQLLAAKINRGWGDADAALEAYSHAALLAPKDFVIIKEYGLYLLQLKQEAKARTELRQAYAMNPEDTQVAVGLRQLNIVPGPSLKNQNDIARPIIPLGPIPEYKVQLLVLPASDRTRPGAPRTPAE